jgi:hypothetical protein
VVREGGSAQGHGALVAAAGGSRGERVLRPRLMVAAAAAAMGTRGEELRVQFAAAPVESSLLPPESALSRLRRLSKR